MFPFFKKLFSKPDKKPSMFSLEKKITWPEEYKVDYSKLKKFQKAGVENASVSDELEIVKRHHPRIYETIELMWGEEKLHEHLLNLMVMESNDRMGFSKEVASSLMKIYIMHMNEFDFESSISSKDFKKQRW